jgi:hypothetical protein
MKSSRVTWTALDLGNTAWSRKQWEAARPYLEEGAYVNYLAEDEGAARVRSACGANYERLTAIKTKDDPCNLFRHNQNIKPQRREYPRRGDEG